jgi:hypothetical protein
MMAPQPAVVAEAELPRPILASYTPEPLPALAAVNMPIKQPSPVPAHKPFIYASLGGPLLAPKPEVDDRAHFPLYQRTEVVGAPEADEDHPDELNYVPFEIAGLMSDVSVTYNRAAASLSRPEQRDLSYLFEDMNRPVAATFRPASGYQGLAFAQRFSGTAVRSFYAELAPPTPTRLAQVDR